MAQKKAVLNTMVQCSFEKFEQNSMNITVQIEQFNNHCDMWDIASAKRVMLFLSCIRHDLYRLLRDQVAPETVKDQTLDILTSKLKHSFESKTNEIVGRYSFHSMKQGGNQSEINFIVLPRKQEIKCDFGVTTDDEQVMMLEQSCKERSNVYPLFHFLFTCLNFLTIYMRTLRDGNYQLNIEGISKMVPSFMFYTVPTMQNGSLST